MESNFTAATRWLDAEECQTWLALWSMMLWLPVRLDAQLRQDSGLTHSECHALSQIVEALNPPDKPRA